MRLSIRLGRLEHFKSLLNGRDGICGETKRRLWYRAGPVSWFGESGEKKLKRGIGGRLWVGYFMSIPHFCHYMVLSCMPKDGCTKCELFLLS